MIVHATIGAALMIGGSLAAAAPQEPLVVTRLPDPDPNFVPPPEPSYKGQRAVSSPENPTLDEAMHDFGQAIGQAAMVEQQQLNARCKSGEPADGSSQQRFAWAAACRYSRH